MKHTWIIVFLILIVGLFMGLTTRANLGNPTLSEIQTELKEPGQAFESSQERARYLLTKQIVENRSFTLDGDVTAVLPDVSYKDGHYISVFPPGLSLIVAPAYLLGTKLGLPALMTFIMPAIAAMLCAIFIYLMATRLSLSKTAAFLAALAFPLATISWSYSVTLYAHVFSALCIIAGLYFALRIKGGSDWNYFFVWLLYGLAILIDYPNAVIMLPIIIYMLLQSIDHKEIKNQDKGAKVLSFRLAFFYTIFPFLLMLGVFLFYNLKTFGSYFDFAHNYRVTSLVNNSLNYNFEISKALDLNFLENGLYTLLFSSSRSVFLYCPILIFAIFGFFWLGKKAPRLTRVIAVTILLDLIVYASFYDPWGGWSYGPRYLIPIMPLLTLLVGQSYEAVKRKSWQLLTFFVLFIASFAIAMLGALTTNLLPPPVEIGKNLNFVQNIQLFFDNITGSLLYGYLKNLFGISLTDYGFALFALFLLIVLPFFFYQVFENIFGKKSNKKLELETYANL